MDRRQSRRQRCRKWTMRLRFRPIRNCRRLFKKISGRWNSSEIVIGKGIAGVAWCTIKTGEKLKPPRPSLPDSYAVPEGYPPPLKCRWLALRRLEHDMTWKPRWMHIARRFRRMANRKQLQTSLRAGRAVSDRLGTSEEACSISDWCMNSTTAPISILRCTAGVVPAHLGPRQRVGQNLPQGRTVPNSRFGPVTRIVVRNGVNTASARLQYLHRAN